MQGQLQFDRMIIDGLNAKAEEIVPSGGMGAMVSDVVLAGVKKRRLSGSVGLDWKRAVAATACFIFIGSGLSLALSPGLQAWASDKGDKFVNHVQVIIQSFQRDGSTGGSSSMVIKEDPAGDQDVSKVKMNIRKMGIVSFPYATPEEAVRAAGFRIKLPAYLPAGYTVPTAIDAGEIMTDGQGGKSVPTGKHLVSMRFDRGTGSFRGLSLIISQEIEQQYKPGFKYRDIKIGDRDARWFESEIALNDTSSPGQEPRAITEHALSWKEGGLTYLLTDYSGLDMAELVKMAESMK